MRSIPWRRADLIERVRSDIWRYLTPSADVEVEILQAAALLQMRPVELRTLGSLQFLVSDELGRLLNQMPVLLRRLSTTTVNDEEISSDRVRGAIRWGRTLGLRYGSGNSHIYATAPSQRAFQTPENELLALLLDETVRLGRELGWEKSPNIGVGRLVNERVSQAHRWGQTRMLTQVARARPSARAVVRVRTGRFKRRYEPVLAAWDRYNDLVGKLDRTSIRHAVEQHALVLRNDPTLFELFCTFEVLRVLASMGWKLEPFRLFHGALRLRGSRGDERLQVFYQTTPRALNSVSAYRDVQIAHGIGAHPLRPDLILRRRHNASTRWLFVEVKGGTRPIEESARAALFDLLAYGKAFSGVLTPQKPYGVGLAWGADLEAVAGHDILLCSPDRIESGLRSALG